MPALASRNGEQSLVDVYMRARDADAQAAFGSVVAFNTEVDADTAEEIMHAMKADKKRIGDKLHLILLKDIGEAVTYPIALETLQNLMEEIWD